MPCSPIQRNQFTAFLLYMANNDNSISNFYTISSTSAVLSHHNHFTALFPGPPECAKRKLLLDFMVLGRITRGKHTNKPGGHHSIRTKQQSTSINLPIFMLEALRAATVPIYPGFRQAQEYAGLHTMWLG